ncbi:MAG: helix-turn-helix domain-containing protein [Patescibacteria group bacterium]
MAFLRKRVATIVGDFGEALHELRELRGFTIAELGRRSGIHPLILETLEKERLEDLADPMYAARHVFVLSETLEGRSRYLVEMYQQLLERRGQLKTHSIFPRPKIRMRDLFVSSRAIGFVGFVLFVLLLAGYVGWQARIVARVPHLSIETPREGATITLPRVTISGVTDPGAIVTVNGLNAFADTRGHFQSILDLPRGLSTIQIESRRRYGSSMKVERHVTYAPHP